MEELLKRKQEAEAEAARPKFLSKKEREELALKKRQARGHAWWRRWGAVGPCAGSPCPNSCRRRRRSSARG